MMATESGPRPQMPPNEQATSNISFAPPMIAPRENQKNYVFVDEHNRHKRLKVMRACEGCRKRKIKCDAATTNSWPCSACRRLKAQCIPPSANYDGELAAPGQTFDQDQYEVGGPNDEAGGSFKQFQVDLGPGFGPEQAYGDMGSYVTQTYQPQPMPAHSHSHNSSITYQAFQEIQDVPDASYDPNPAFPTPPPHNPDHSAGSPESWQSDPTSSANNLSEVLGELKIDETGAPPYMSQPQRGVPEKPVIDEAEESLKDCAPISSGPVQIPASFMPSDADAQHYFEIYFTNVHPYVPVVDRDEFLRQWATNRDSISPLILETMFSCAIRLLNDSKQSEKWLALAGKHSEYFMDNPRLSTLQALLILMKARESSPKRGYYYRSWMSVVNMVAMAKDLGLHEHHHIHCRGESCESTSTECIVKTRIWQTLFVCELMIGGPQGRTDMSVAIDTVMMDTPEKVTGQSAGEYMVSRNFVYFVMNIKTVRLLNDIYGKIKRNKNWMADPRFLSLNPAFHTWLHQLPTDLRIQFASDGSPPWIRSHFIGNLHSYYFLGVIMLNRPVLAAADFWAADGSWKRHMAVCYSSAKKLCRLQEAILSSFGLSGLVAMQRGLSFTVYGVLTCLELHLAAVTSPYPEISTDSRDYLTRHMRILEQCTKSWSVPGMSESIQALREAFSEDVTKPFVLKTTFPYSSPSPMADRPTPPPNVSSPYSRQDSQFYQTMSQYQDQQDLQNVQNVQNISPPPSATLGYHSTPSQHTQYVDMTASQQQHQMQAMVQQPAWNPSPIFNQWNAAFGTPASNSAATSPNLMTGGFTSTNSPGSGANMSSTMQPLMSPGSQNQGQGQSHIPPPQPTFVTPTMWRESVASVYEEGLKRRWEFGEDGLIDQLSKRVK